NLRSPRHLLGSWTFLTFDDVEFHSISLGEGLESRARDRAVVNEAVLLPVVRCDESKALRVVEPLHFAGRTHSLLLKKLCLGERKKRPTLDNLLHESQENSRWMKPTARAGTPALARLGGKHSKDRLSRQ